MLSAKYFLYHSCESRFNPAFSQAEFAVAARRGPCSCGKPPQMARNTADAVKSACPQGERCKSFYNHYKITIFAHSVDIEDCKMLALLLFKIFFTSFMRKSG